MERVHEGDAARTPPGRPMPIRTCVGCRQREPSAQLLRVVVVDDLLVPDPKRRRPGRGAWLHLDPECLRLAERRRAFPRALRVRGSLDIAPVHRHFEQRLRPEPSREPPAAEGTGKQVDPS